MVGVGAPTLLLFLQPDTSGALLLLAMVALLVFVAGAPLRALFATGAAGALALVAAALAPVYTAFFYHWHGALLVAVLSILIFIKHRTNIARLRDGSEPKIGSKS